MDCYPSARSSTGSPSAADAFPRCGIAYDGPVFAIWGDHDRLVPASHAQGGRMALPQAKVDVWSGMGHHPIRERFAGFIATIERATGAAERRPRRRLRAQVA